MKLSNMTANEYDEPTISITLTGAHEIYRFAHHPAQPGQPPSEGLTAS